MYSNKPSFTFGFHGLDKKVAYKILTHQQQFKHSHNNYNWLAKPKKHDKGGKLKGKNPHFILRKNLKRTYNGKNNVPKKAAQ